MSSSAGRPTKLIPETQARIIKMLESGGLRKDAALATDIDLRTFRLWMALGRKRDAKPIYKNFFRDVLRAEAFAANFYVSVVKNAADRVEETVKETVNPDGTMKREVTRRRVLDANAAMWWLERKRPEDFGKKAVDEILKLQHEVVGLRAMLDSLQSRVVGDDVATTGDMST